MRKYSKNSIKDCRAKRPGAGARRYDGVFYIILEVGPKFAVRTILIAPRRNTFHRAVRALDSTKQSDWAAGPASLSLGGREVHVWRTRLDDGDWGRALLNEEEAARADRFIRDIHGRRFAAARGALRVLIGRYLSVEAAGVAFDYNEFGKPSLAPELASHRLEFNVSHSEDMALLAFSRSRVLGVDIEQLRERADFEKLARRYFSPAEVRSLEGMPILERLPAFYRCWTRKEAYIKAKGKGLSISLSSFDVAFAAGESPTLLRAEGGGAECARWTIHDIQPGGQFAGALVVEAREDRDPPELFDFAPSPGG